MSIVRTQHNKENPYVMINKKALEDEDLSWGAKGLWAYLMSRPDDWTVRVAQLKDVYEGKGGGEKAIYSFLNELIEQGYCQRSQPQCEQGKFLPIEYIVTEFKNKLPHLPERRAVERDAVERDVTNKGYILSNDLNKKSIPQSSSSSVVDPPREEIDDDEPAGGNKIEEFKEEIGDITFTNTRGETQTMSQSEVYKHFISKPFSTETLKEAIRRTKTTQGSINNVLRYIESTCIQIDSQNENKQGFQKKQKTSNDSNPKEEPKVIKEQKQTMTWEECMSKLNNNK